MAGTKGSELAKVSKSHKAKAMSGTFTSLPDRVDLGSDINEQLVVELYSK